MMENKGQQEVLEGIKLMLENELRTIPPQYVAEADIDSNTKEDLLSRWYAIRGEVIKAAVRIAAHEIYGKEQPKLDPTIESAIKVLRWREIVKNLRGILEKIGWIWYKFKHSPDFELWEIPSIVSLNEREHLRRVLENLGRDYVTFPT